MHLGCLATVIIALCLPLAADGADGAVTPVPAMQDIYKNDFLIGAAVGSYVLKAYEYTQQADE